MKTKNLNASLLILLGLLFLSFAFFVTAEERSNTSNNILLDSDQDGLTDSEERIYGTDPHNSDTDGDGYSDGAEVKSGYNPLKSAPGDKLSNVSVKSASTEEIVTDVPINTEENKKNLTDDLTDRISQVINDEEGDPEMKMSEVQEMVNSALNNHNVEIKLPDIYEDEIKIKKQKYGHLSDEKAREKRAEDFVDYIIAIYYILASNSPEPITSSSDLSTILVNYSNNMISAISSRDITSVEKLSKNGEKILEQMKEVEVPEDTVELHIKTLSMAQYAASLKDDFAPKRNDPLGDIVGLSRIQNYMVLISGFSLQAEAKFLEYGLEYNDKIRGKIKGLGLIAPDPGELPSTILNNSEEEQDN